MATTNKPVPGPSLETYVETRFNLLLAATDKMETGILVRIEDLDLASRARYEGVRSEVAHTRELLQLAQDNSKRAVDKAEAAQTAHNVAANEWRGTLNDFKATLTAKGEFDRLAADFSAYRLEVSKLMAAQSGEKSGAKDNKDDSKALIALAVSIASALIVAYSVLRPSTPAAQQPSPQVYVPAPAGALIPSAPTTPAR